MGRRDAFVSPDRGTINVYTVVLTCVLMLFALETSTGQATSGIHKMAKDINKALMKALEGINDVEYADYHNNAVYKSSTQFNSKGMAVLYNITNKFMKIVLPDVLPEEIILIENGTPQLKQNDFVALAQHYTLFIVFIIALLFFGVLMPFCGVCFCCCRCCGNCGGRSKPFDKKKDLCKKLMLGSLLIALGTLFLFGVVCAFASNEHMQHGTDELTKNLNTSVEDVNTYVDSTKGHIDVLLGTNYEQFRTVLVKTLDQSSDILYDRLAEISKATSMNDAENVLSNLTEVQTSLNEMAQTTNKLRVEASQLNDAMRKVKRDLLDTLQNCRNTPACAELQDQYVSKLGTDIDFNKIPDVHEPIKELERFLDSGIIVEIRAGIDKLNNIKRAIKNNVKDRTNDIKGKIAKTGIEIAKQRDAAVKVLDDMKTQLNQLSRRHLPEADYYIKEYSRYRYYMGLGVSCMLLLIALCIVLGLICGVCGKRPDSYNDDCCNKGAGGKFLICGVGFMFLSALVLVVIIIIHTIGIFIQLGVCEPIRRPNENTELINYVDKNIDFEKLGWDVRLPAMLNDCYKNKSAYKVFNLERKVNLNKVRNYVRDMNIDELRDMMKEEIKKISMSNVELLDEKAKQLFANVSNSSISNIDFDKFVEELSVDFTTVNLMDFQQQLTLLISALEKKSELESVSSELRLTKIQMDAYIEKIYDPMVRDANIVMAMANRTSMQLKFGKRNFKEAIVSLVSNIEDAQYTLQGTGTEQLTNITEQFIEQIELQVQRYLNRVVDNITMSVGDCGPLALIINGTLTSTCDKVLLPMNGFWFSILWCLALFVPCIVVSVKLASLYNKFDPYTGSFTEGEYLYDAYADRENIPLARAKHRKKKHKKSRSDGRYITETLEAGREYPGGSHHPDTRYADMAPKHFEDYPNGGPPQYQRATEYERPPPYYYPGTGEQQQPPPQH